MTYTTTIPGLPGGPITTNHPIYVRLIPANNTYQRPGIKTRSPRRDVEHGTGNPNSSAASEAIYLVDQRAEGRQASYHSITDDKQTSVHIPLDEVGWHAADGAGPGNMNGYANEMIESTAVWGDPVRRARCIENKAEWMGIVAARLGVTKPEQHWDFNYQQSMATRHNCPQKLRTVYINGQLAWDLFVERWNVYRNAELARMDGGTASTVYTVGDRIEVTAANINVRQGCGTGYRILTTVQSGAKATVIADDAGTFTANANGYTWLNVRIDGWGTGWMAIGTSTEPWIAKSSTPAPVEPPVKYAPVVPIKELDITTLTLADKYNTAPGIATVNESEFVLVADVIEFKRTSPAKQYALDNAKEVRKPYQEGDRAIAGWLVKSTEGTWWYVLLGADDEWVRVKYVDTVRIADAPIIPES
jgi:hypothetical protein